MGKRRKKVETSGYFSNSVPVFTTLDREKRNTPEILRKEGLSKINLLHLLTPPISILNASSRLQSAVLNIGDVSDQLTLCLSLRLKSNNVVCGFTPLELEITLI